MGGSIPEDVQAVGEEMAFRISGSREFPVNRAAFGGEPLYDSPPGGDRSGADQFYGLFNWQAGEGVYLLADLRSDD